MTGDKRNGSSVPPEVLAGHADRSITVNSSVQVRFRHLNLIHLLHRNVNMSLN